MLKIEIIGEGTRYDISKALKIVADNIWSEDKIEEIYNINGCVYLDHTLEVTLTDLENIEK